MALPDGLYDQVLTQTLHDLIAGSTDENTRSLQALNADDAPARLAEVLVAQLAKILDDLDGEGGDKLRQQLELVNFILVSLRERLGQGAERADIVAAPARILQAIHRRSAPPVPPETGLAAPWLFTAGKGSPALLTELRRELAACDRVDILVSFITHSGVRKLLDVLQAITAVGADGEPRTRIRVLTTTYTGATEARALDALAGLPGCEIRVSLDGRRTRLHAKAWLFRRRTGFGSAYVGSANLSGAALMGGLEWTTKFTERGQPELFERACAHFETLWEDSEFQRYDPADPAHRSALREALRRESGEGILARPTFFELSPKAYQQEMLDQLQLERDHGRWRNLVVAATGTGKTVVAAFDYRRLCLTEGGQPRLLFVAHREEILKQALRTYREVLRDHTFGALLAGGMEPEGFDQLERAGIPALCVVGDTPQDERRQAPERLARGEVAALVTCDLYNEGVDLPMVDTLLLLRPTQSPVLFQQQIGRGLRLSPGKEGCLILDFVGRHQVGFRFDRLLSTLTGLPRGQLIEAVDRGFGSLPPGCHIHLQRQAREQVLASLKRLVQQNWRRLQTELQAYAALRGRSTVRLASFLREQAIGLEEVYRSSGRSGWTRLKRDAGLLATPLGAEDDYFGRRFGDLLHVDDPARTDLLLKVAEPGASDVPQGERDRQLLQMLAYQVDGQTRQIGSGEDFLQRLRAHPELLAELGEIGEVLQSTSSLRQRAVPGLEDVPLCLHAAYGVREILTAVGWLTAGRRTPFQAGVLALHERKVELLFVTLDKRAGYHEKIAYHDYAISAERFHWQSQNAAGPETPAGRRYLESPGNGWRFQLFVRTAKGQPYRACGPVALEQAEGSKPMSLRWRLEVPLPGPLVREFSILRDG